MDSPVMEDHIKFEAEESEHLTDHVWEEVVIDDSDNHGWRHDMEIEGNMTDVTMESTASESTESSGFILNSGDIKKESEVITDQIEKSIDVEENNYGEIVSHVDETPKADKTTDVQRSSDGGKDHPIQPVVTSLSQPVQKFMNFNNLKLIPKGSFVNIGNKKMKLVTLTGDKKLIAGKVVTMSNNDSRIITGKVVTLGNSDSKMLPAKVVNVSNNSNVTTANIVNNKVVPAKVVSIPNTKLKPIAPANKEVTIYITGLAGDKVQIRDTVQMGNKMQFAQRGDAESWKSDHIDACLPITPVSGDSEDINTQTEVAEGQHFLLNSSQNYDTASLTCHICERQFTQLKYLISHQQTHTLGEPISCDLCNKQFKRRYDLLRHKRRSHADDAMYECDICHKTFTDNVLANKHRLTHTDDFKFCCEVCNRPFKYVHDLKRHRSIHFDEKPFDCEICGKKFKHKSNLKTHQATHYSEKPYSCTLCDKKFHQKGNLKTHLIVHTGEMPFVCDICSKRFHTRSGLLNHSYSHSDEKPFQCDICDKTFNWKSGLLTHQQTHRQGQRVQGIPAVQGVIAEEVQVIEIGPIPVDN